MAFGKSDVVGSHEKRWTEWDGKGLDFRGVKRGRARVVGSLELIYAEDPNEKVCAQYTYPLFHTADGDGNRYTQRGRIYFSADRVG